MAAFPSEWQIRQAVRQLCGGGIIAYPTEAVFGLGCDPGNQQAVARLLAMKNRDYHKGLILVASSRQQLEPWLENISPAWQRRLDKSWPGPNTWLIPAAENCPAWLTGMHHTLAVRVSAHPVIRRLCDRLNGAITSTSANVAGTRPARTALELRQRLKQQPDYVVPGNTGTLTNPTMIRDLATGRTIRPG